MKKSGSTWWGQRWVEALERMSSGYSNRLSRGRTYARAGRTHDLVIKDGKVTAKVTGSRSTPYKVTLTLVRLTDGVWGKAIAAMAEKAQFSAELLAGQMPQEIDAAFKAAGASIFPVNEDDLTTNCSCPDWANPCKHVAAMHYVLGEAFDRDPFLLFELRGRSKEQVLAALRAARAREQEHAVGPRKDADATEAPMVPTVALGRGKAADWERPPEALPALRLSFEAPPVSGGLVRQLGTPSGWSSEMSPAEALGPMIRAAAERARAMAMAEAAKEGGLVPGTVMHAGNATAKAAGTSARASRTEGSRETPAVRGKKAAGKRAAGKKAAGKEAAGKEAAGKKAAGKKAGKKAATRTAGRALDER